MASLLFADDAGLLASLVDDLLYTLERFAVECKAAVMKISTLKFEAMVLCCKSAHSGWVGVAAPSQRVQVSWGFDPQGEDLDLRVALRSNPNPSQRALGSD